MVFICIEWSFVEYLASWWRLYFSRIQYIDSSSFFRRSFVPVPYSYLPCTLFIRAGGRRVYLFIKWNIDCIFIQHNIILKFWLWIKVPLKCPLKFNFTTLFHLVQIECFLYFNLIVLSFQQGIFTTAQICYYT